MAKHPNKHLREAIKYAEEQGWRVVKSGGQAHIWGKLYCPARQRGGCIIRVYSTPRVPSTMLVKFATGLMVARISTYSKRIDG